MIDLASEWEGCGRVCLEAGCFECCLETEMPLSEEDVRRLQAGGREPSEFAVESEEGEIHLRNARGGCFFLKDGRCSAYEDRPDGCRFYPLVLDTDTSHFVVDAYCPQSGSFKPGRVEKDRLKALIRRLDGEAEKRLRLRR